ncbi:hypothetical protein BN1051_02900 [Arthrobacter saudimassiliensis]|uniref:UPF0225 protein BN1051_02900 n=1 Tax=Arthrobacter saudimassiliensis TaxID=1461584 RepID=A0A078MT77_9MICC|nr:hypothetical protein BN1051_02900 [Arthrobacter saudimassiliensis]
MTNAALPPEPPTDSRRCPCLSGEDYPSCCGRFHAGAPAPTAEALMRSRYSAFALGDSGYLLQTWHPDTRPRDLDLDPDLQWRRLDVLGTAAGGPLDTEGTVHFKAYWRAPEGRGVQEENSRFLRLDGRWYYLDGR